MGQVHNGKNLPSLSTSSIIGLVVEFVVAIDEARVRFTDDARSFLSSTTSIIGLVVEFVVAIDEARVRFTDDAQIFTFCPIHLIQHE